MLSSRQMKIITYVFVLFILAGCTQGEQTLLFECNEQNQGEACNKLGKARTGEEALKFFRQGCKLENTNSCVSLADNTPDKEEALRVLKFSCDRGNTRACAKFAELSVQEKSK